jgi:hypothetical protein
MIDWIKTVRGRRDPRSAFATMIAWGNLGLPRLVSSSEAPIQARIEALEQFNRNTRA